MFFVFLSLKDSFILTLSERSESQGKNVSQNFFWNAFLVLKQSKNHDKRIIM
jgi:hypothetical protein